MTDPFKDRIQQAVNPYSMTSNPYLDWIAQQEKPSLRKRLGKWVPLALAFCAFFTVDALILRALDIVPTSVVLSALACFVIAWHVALVALVWPE